MMWTKNESSSFEDPATRLSELTIKIRHLLSDILNVGGKIATIAIQEDVSFHDMVLGFWESVTNPEWYNFLEFSYFAIFGFSESFGQCQQHTHTAKTLETRLLRSHSFNKVVYLSAATIITVYIDI
mgnify:CR=1 FL=1